MPIQRGSSEKVPRGHKKNLKEVLPKFLSNLVHHIQVASNPLNLSEVHFNCLKVTTEPLNFNVYNLEGKDREKF